MPALTQIIFGHDVEVLKGILIPIPAEFFAKSQIEHYRNCALGWSKCPLGYSTYAVLDSLGRKYVIPGILLEGDHGKRRKFPGYQVRFKKQQIEDYLRPHLEQTEQIRGQRDQLFRNLTHDLRAISTEIYHEALSAREWARTTRQTELANALDLVLSSQQMMSVRLDIVDYESGISTVGPPSNIEVFKKVEKVFLSFQNKLRAKKMGSSLLGSSYSTVVGPNTLDIALFVLIENAIKYSPGGVDVMIEVSETGKNVVVSIKSWGPCIAINERQKIFDSGFRGAAAQRFRSGSGSGVGLYAASTIAKEHFKGNLSVVQESQRRVFDGQNYYETTFMLSIPIHQLATGPQRLQSKFRRPRLRGRDYRKAGRG